MKFKLVEEFRSETQCKNHYKWHVDNEGDSWEDKERYSPLLKDIFTPSVYKTPREYEMAADEFAHMLAQADFSGYDEDMPNHPILDGDTWKHNLKPGQIIGYIGKNAMNISQDDSKDKQQDKSEDEYILFQYIRDDAGKYVIFRPDPSKKSGNEIKSYYPISIRKFYNRLMTRDYIGELPHNKAKIAAAKKAAEEAKEAAEKTAKDIIKDVKNAAKMAIEATKTLNSLHNKKTVAAEKKIKEAIKDIEKTRSLVDKANDQLQEIEELINETQLEEIKTVINDAETAVQTAEKTSNQPIFNKFKNASRR